MNVVKIGNDPAPKAEKAPVPMAKPAGYSSEAYVAALSGSDDYDGDLPTSATRVFWAAVGFRHAMDLINVTGEEDHAI